MYGHWSLSCAAMMRAVRMSRFPMYDIPSADFPVSKQSLLVVEKQVPNLISF